MMGETLFELRQEAGLTQEELGNILHVNKHCISSYERNKSEPLDEIKMVISRYFHVSVDYLLGITDESISAKDEETAIGQFGRLTPEMRIEIEKYIEYLKYKNIRR